jgi:hypothetical protein
MFPRTQGVESDLPGNSRGRRAAFRESTALSSRCAQIRRVSAQVIHRFVHRQAWRKNRQAASRGDDGAEVLPSPVRGTVRAVPPSDGSFDTRCDADTTVSFCAPGTGTSGMRMSSGPGCPLGTEHNVHGCAVQVASDGRDLVFPGTRRLPGATAAR